MLQMVVLAVTWLKIQYSAAYMTSIDLLWIWNNNVTSLQIVFQDHICIKRLNNAWTSPASFSRDSPTAINVAPNNHFSPMLHSVTSINKQFILQTADTIGLHYGWNKDRTCSVARECDLFYQGRYMWPMRSSLSGFITVSSEHRTG